MDIVTINAVLLPWFAIVFVPNAIRDKETGKYLGFRNTKVLILLLALASIEAVLVFTVFGINGLSIARWIFNTALPFVLALVWLAYTQKRHYGNEFKMKLDKSS